MDLYTKLTANMEALSANFQSRMHQYEESLQQLASPKAPAHSDLSALSKDFTDFKSMMWKTVTLLKSQIELIIQGFDRNETVSRRKVLLIHGVPEAADQNPSQTALDIFVNKLKLTDITSADIAVCHRLGSRTSKPRPLLVRFSRYAVRSAIWNAKTLLKGTGITVSEFLTKMRHDIFMAARKHFGIHQCWTSEGIINVQLPDKSRHRIESLSELNKLTQKSPLSAKVMPAAPAPAASGGTKSEAPTTSSSRAVRQETRAKRPLK